LLRILASVGARMTREGGAVSESRREQRLFLRMKTVGCQEEDGKHHSPTRWLVRTPKMRQKPLGQE